VLSSAGGLRFFRATLTGMTIFVSLLVALIGLLMYALAANPKLQEIGRISYFAGLLAFLLQFGPSVVALFGNR
jgi:hypothetical protein